MGLCVAKKGTISLIKCDVGSLAGHHVVPKPLFDIAGKNLKKAVNEGIINNFIVFNAGDDLELLMAMKKASKTGTFTNLLGIRSKKQLIKPYS
jgi:fructose 1,6-bisphosphatase